MTTFSPGQVLTTFLADFFNSFFCHHHEEFILGFSSQAAQEPAPSPSPISPPCVTQQQPRTQPGLRWLRWSHPLPHSTGLLAVLIPGTSSLHVVAAGSPQALRAPLIPTQRAAHGVSSC